MCFSKVVLHTYLREDVIGKLRMQRTCFADPKGTTMRPEKISAQLIEALCEDIAKGYSYDQAALNNGIAASTFFRWMLKGKKTEVDPIYREFVELVEEASNFSEPEALQLIRSSAKIDRNWKAAAWFLERRFPEKYAKKSAADSKRNESTNE